MLLAPLIRGRALRVSGDKARQSHRCELPPSVPRAMADRAKNSGLNEVANSAKSRHGMVIMKKVAGGQRETGDRITGEGERSVGLRFSCGPHPSVPPGAGKWRLDCRQQVTLGIPHGVVSRLAGQ